MARSKRVFSPEFREDAVKLVIDSLLTAASGDDGGVIVGEDGSVAK